MLSPRQRAPGCGVGGRASALLTALREGLPKEAVGRERREGGLSETWPEVGVLWESQVGSQICRFESRFVPPLAV